MTKEKINKLIVESVVRYKKMEQDENYFILCEIKYHYADMSRGGDGGTLGFKPENWPLAHTPSIREFNYPNYPDRFFQEVCDLLGWLR